MIAALLLMLAQDAPPSETVASAFPAKRLTCTVTAADASTFEVTVNASNGAARLKSAREDLFPSGAFEISRAFVTRQDGGKPVDYRVSVSSDRPAGHYSLGMRIEGGVPVQAWLRLMPAGSNSSGVQEIGSAHCIAEKTS